jgi:hypothetical protein
VKEKHIDVNDGQAWVDELPTLVAAIESGATLNALSQRYGLTWGEMASILVLFNLKTKNAIRQEAIKKALREQRERGE